MSDVYAACTVCEPAANADVAVVATPFTRVTAGTAVPSIVNTTDPVGVPPRTDTVAENVTLSPNTDGFSDDDTAVTVEPAVTD